MSTWNLSTWKSGLKTFFPRRIVSSIGSVNSGMFSLLVLSTWESVHLSVCLLSICTLGSMAAWHSAHVGLCLLLVLTILDSYHIRSVFLGVCPTRFLSTWILSTWKPVHIIFCHLRIVSTIGCVHSTFCSLLVLSTWHYVYTGLFLIGILSTLLSVHLVVGAYDSRST